MLGGLANAALALGGCSSPDPKAVTALQVLETYWIVDSTRGDQNYLAPALRVELRNTGKEPLDAVQASASFRRQGEAENWGAAFEQVASTRQPLAPGQARVVVLRSDGRYHSAGTPEEMLRSPEFKDTRAEIYTRVGASDWVKLAEAAVERRIGTRSVEPIVNASP
jgi:hypothetical protein